MASFTQKLLVPTFTLASGQFTESGTDTLTLPPRLRMSAKINKAGAPSGSKLSLRIEGMTPSQMNDLTTLGMKLSLVPRNVVSLQAGDASGMSVAFVGTVLSAYVDYQSMPEVAFQVDANSGVAEGVISIPPNSFPGSIDVATVMQTLATQAGLQFENNVVQVTLPPTYLWGSARTQIKELAAAARVSWCIDDGVLAIWPYNGARGASSAIPQVSPSTGLVGFPSFTDSGVLLKTLYNPVIKFQGLIHVSSATLTGALAPTNALSLASLPANGIWAVAELDHDLESVVPHGKWFSSIIAYNSAYTFPPVQP